MVPCSQSAETRFLPAMWTMAFLERLGGSTISISAGMLNLGQEVKTIGHIYCSDKPAYYEIADDLPQFPQSSKGKIDGSI